MTKKPEEKKKNRSCFFWGLGCLGIVILVGSLTLNGVLGFALLAATSDSSGYINNEFFDEITVSGDPESDNKIAVIHVNGVIAHQSLDENIFASSFMSVEDIALQLKQAENDEKVKAVVLYINSPGGTESASDYLYNEIKKFQSSGKPVFAFFSETAASGAYYVSLPADMIYAEPSCIVGSIGVIMAHLNIEGLYEKIGVKEEVFKTGELKDIFSSTREITDEEKEIIQGLIDDAMGRFKSRVLNNREIEEKYHNEIFDSRIFTAKQALENGLVDQVGYFDSVLEDLAVFTDLTYYQVIEYDYKFSFSDFFLGFSSYLKGQDITSEIRHIVTLNQPRLMYLWK